VEVGRLLPDLTITKWEAWYIIFPWVDPAKDLLLSGDLLFYG
jgi:hypothetical protein